MRLAESEAKANATEAPPPGLGVQAHVFAMQFYCLGKIDEKASGSFARAQCQRGERLCCTSSVKYRRASLPGGHTPQPPDFITTALDILPGLKAGEDAN